MSQAKPYDDAVEDDGTIALLTGEISRLEAELLARDEALAAAPEARRDPAPDPHVGTLLRRIADLDAELAGRDETIALLVDQTSLFEEAAAASKAEWEQISRWVEEVERRVEGQGERDARAGDELQHERRRSEALRERFDSERRSWDVSRLGLEAELKDLRGRASALTTGSDHTEALERENRRLREESTARALAAVSAEELAPLRQRLAEALERLGEAQAELARERDERLRERNEHQVELSAVRSQFARDSLERAASNTAAPAGASPAPGADHALEADLRIRAFREHLKDLHQRESEEKATKGLASRLSRLWRHTGPG